MIDEKIIPRKIFTVLIKNKEYDVFSIIGKEHKGFTDVPKTWWIYYSDRLPEGRLPEIDSKHWYPYNTNTLRRCWEIKLKQINNSKHKWETVQFSNSISVEMWCDNKLIYEFTTNGKAMDFAFAKIQYLQVILSEHPYNFFEREKENGRKIYWYGLPATILNSSEPGRIKIKPDYTEDYSKKEWWAELHKRKFFNKNVDDLNTQLDEIDEEDFIEDANNDIINFGDALSDANIYWFRK